MPSKIRKLNPMSRTDYLAKYHSDTFSKDKPNGVQLPKPKPQFNFKPYIKPTVLGLWALFLIVVAFFIFRIAYAKGYDAKQIANVTCYTSYCEITWSNGKTTYADVK